MSIKLSLPELKKTILSVAGVLFLLSCAVQIARADDDNSMPALKPEVKDNIAKVQSKCYGLIKGLNVTQNPPAGFPLPLYSSNVQGTTFVQSPQGGPVSATIVTKDPAASAYTWYAQQLKAGGWAIADHPASRNTKVGPTYHIQATKGDTMVSVTCATGRKGFSGINIAVHSAAKPQGQ